MHIGMVGLGRMGGNMRDRIRDAGHEVTGFDVDPEVSEVASLADLVAALPAGDRIVWVMVPAGAPTLGVLTELADLLTEGDLVIEGGNSHYKDDQRNAAMLAERGVGYIDAGISGGIWGRTYGYGTMVGGSEEDVARAMPIFDALRPEGPAEEGFVHAGGVGAGHYSKMVRNGIEYGLMQAYAEGYEIIASRSDLIPDVTAVLRAWQRGTVVRSWLLELLVDALEDDPGLASLLAARAPGRRAGGRPRARLDRLRQRFWRGPVDPGGSRRECHSGAHPVRGPVRALRIPPGGVAGDEGDRRAT